MKSVHTDEAPKAIGPYSQAVIAGNFIFCSGQVGVIPETKTLAVGIENQTRQILKNIENVLKATGCSLKNVVKTTVYLKNVSDFPAMNSLYAECFGDHKPARATVEVSDLPKGSFKDVLIEMDAIAVNPVTPK